MQMAEYPRHFPVVEVQQTFYQPPQDATLIRWRRQAPPGFEFTLKAWQLITHGQSSPTYRRLGRALSARDAAQVGHFRATDRVEEGWQRTLECARLLMATAILFQCPARFTPDPQNIHDLRRFFTRIRRPRGVRLMWEPRGEWPGPLVAELCQELDLVHALDPFVTRSIAPSRYFRLHGFKGGRHTYTDEELAVLLEEAVACSAGYVMFNNLPRIGDARRFQGLLGRAGRQAT